MPLYAWKRESGGKIRFSSTILKLGDIIFVNLGVHSSLHIKRGKGELSHRSSGAQQDPYYHVTMNTPEEARNLVELLTDALGLGFCDILSASGDQMAFEIVAAEKKGK